MVVTGSDRLPVDVGANLFWAKISWPTVTIQTLLSEIISPTPTPNGTVIFERAVAITLGSHRLPVTVFTDLMRVTFHRTQCANAKLSRIINTPAPKRSLCRNRARMNPANGNTAP